MYIHDLFPPLDVCECVCVLDVGTATAKQSTPNSPPCSFIFCFFFFLCLRFTDAAHLHKKRTRNTARRVHVAEGGGGHAYTEANEKVRGA